MMNVEPPDICQLQAALPLHHGPRRYEYAQCLYRLVNEYPKSTSVLGALAWHCVTMRRFEEAVDYYQRILNLSPDYLPWVKDPLARCKKALADWDYLSKSLHVPKKELPEILNRVRDLLVVDDSIPPHEGLERWEITEHFLRAAGLVCLEKGLMGEGIRLIEQAEHGIAPLLEWERKFIQWIRRVSLLPVPRFTRRGLSRIFVYKAAEKYQKAPIHRRPPWALLGITLLARDIPEILVKIGSKFRQFRSPAYPFLALERALYEQALRCQPKDEHALQGLFLVASEEENSPRAERIAMELVETYPENRWSWLALGYVRNGMENWKGVVEACEAGLQKHPGDTELQVNLAAVLAEQGETLLASEALRNAPEQASHNDLGLLAPFLRNTLKQPPPEDLKEASRLLEESFVSMGGNELLETGGIDSAPLPPDAVCPWCGGTHLRAITRSINTQQNIAWCGDCDYYHVNPQPTLEDAMESYSCDYLRGAYSHSIEWIRTSEGTSEGLYGIHRDLFEWLENEPKVLFNQLPKGRALDIGCAVGVILTILERRGWSTIGVEPSQQLADLGRANGREIRPGFLEDQRFEEGTFDLVAAMHVLEHVTHPSAFLKEIARVTRPGGFLLLSLPVAKCLRHYLEGTTFFDQPDHLSFFSLGNVGKLLSDTGYETIAFNTPMHRIYAFEARRYWRIPLFPALERRMAAWRGESIVDVFARKVN